MKRVAIIGLGLMGGSLGLALKARRFPGTVAGYARRAETRSLALQRKAVDEAFDRPERAVEGADLAVFCVPILSIPDLVKACAGGLGEKCLVTDVGSTKAELGDRIRGMLRGTPATYVGSHPITGSEQQGLDAARPDLYEGAVVVVTARTGEPGRGVDQIQEFWRGLGAVVRVMTPEEHDRMMARTSHLPHLVAALLASTVGRDGDPKAVGAHCGPGFRDATRIADGSPEVWHDIIRSNRERVADELWAFGKDYQALSEMIRAGDFKRLHQFLEQARARRRALMQNKSGRDERNDS